MMHHSHAVRCRLALLILLLSLFNMNVHADFGPKPSVSVEFESAPPADGKYYVTLLSETASTGPWSSITDSDNMDPGYLAFSGYTDPDGYFFLGCCSECSQTGQFVWDYYPPSRFKVCVYIPSENCYLSSECLEQYAFRSEYLGTFGSDGSLSVRRAYGTAAQVLGVLFRMAVTIAVELILALLFGFRYKKQLLLITGANILTQLVLNAALLTGGFQPVFIFYAMQYFLLEAAITAGEAVLYLMLIRRLADPRSAGGRHPVLYALCANAASFLTGYLITDGLRFLF